MNTDKDFVPHQQSLDMKELGFDEPCMGYRDGGGHLMIKGMPHCDISSPTFSQCFRWFREKYKLEGDISHFNDNKFKWSFQIKNITNDSSQSQILVSTPFFDTYEEAELAAIVKLIEIAKNK